MCMFSQPVQHVAKTCIFARGAGAEQLLVYSMDFRAAADLAMILPLPVPPRPEDDAVRFIDLSGYSEYFVDMRKAFPPRWVSGAVPSAAPSFAGRSKLVVHDVGAFEASFVPTLGDFDRLDPRFRLPAEIWNRLPAYADWGFAVFKLKSSREQQHAHPMAFAFPRRDRSRLFFPTVHVHDGAVHREALFDHELFCQSPTTLEAPMPPPVAPPIGQPAPPSPQLVLSEWQSSDRSLAYFVDIDRSAGTIDIAAPGHRREMQGQLPNQDVWVEAADCA